MNKYSFTLLLLSFFIALANASSVIYPRRYNLINRLEQVNVDVNKLGCKCIMSSPTEQNTDTTLCMCFNRRDGTMNDSSNCRAYTDGVFTFCTDVTNDTKLWQKCVEHYCPCQSTSKPPKNKVVF